MKAYDGSLHMKLMILGMVSTLHHAGKDCFQRVDGKRGRRRKGSMSLSTLEYTYGCNVLSRWLSVLARSFGGATRRIYETQVKRGRSWKLLGYRG